MGNWFPDHYSFLRIISALMSQTNDSDKNTPTAPQIPEKPKEKIKRGADDLFEGIGVFLRELTDLKKSLDIEGTIVNIKNNKRMRGSNAWLLMSSIMIASLGLDLNSPAVIIGAMLISPLMSPILGIGLAVGINDKTTLSISLQHFGVAIVIAILTSTLYFSLTPFGEITPEIKSRTAPTLLDVMVAFFGGLAGIISGSRKDVSNAIPGVAIATALMPPLCVTGFSIATGNVTYMINSFYFFFLNATFIAIATYLMVRYMNFPLRSYSTAREAANTKWLLFGFSVVLIAPSAFILFGVLQDIRHEKQMDAFIEVFFDNAICEKTKLEESDSLELKIFLFDTISVEKEDRYRNILKEKYGVKNARLKFFQTKLPQFNTSEMEASLKQELANMIEAKEKINDERDKIIENLRSKLDSLNDKELKVRSIREEVKILYPSLEECNLYLPDKKENKDELLIPLAQLKWKDRSSHKGDEERILRYLMIRAGVDTLKIAH
jgi:uncharacterized hydrophobic protein (TIGR00271 family)